MFNPNQYNNPYMMQNYQMQAFQPQRQNSLLGEMVTDYETVKTARVDMSGQTSYYPMMDGRAIYTKTLMPDGTARINQYELKLPETQAQDQSPLAETLNSINEKIDALTERFNSMWGSENE